MEDAPLPEDVAGVAGGLVGEPLFEEEDEDLHPILKVLLSQEEVDYFFRYDVFDLAIITCSSITIINSPRCIFHQLKSEIILKAYLLTLLESYALILFI